MRFVYGNNRSSFFASLALELIPTHKELCQTDSGTLICRKNSPVQSKDQSFQVQSFHLTHIKDSMTECHFIFQSR